MPHLDALGITVSNMARAKEFYSLLGLQFPESSEDHQEVVTSTGLRLMLDTEKLVQSFSDADFSKKTPQRITPAFLCDSPSEVDACYAQIIAAGFTGITAPWDAFWGQRYAQVADPDGTVVDLFAAL